MTTTTDHYNKCPNQCNKERKEIRVHFWINIRETKTNLSSSAEDIIIGIDLENTNQTGKKQN